MIGVIVVFTFSLVLGAHSFMFDDPCSVSPHFGSIPDDPDTMYTVNVPASCTNGTFRWDYPKGHVMLNFHNVHHLSTSICIHDWLGGDVFTITDVTAATVVSTASVLGRFTDDVVACTTKTTASTIVLKIDAPEEMRYMGEVAYAIQH